MSKRRLILQLMALPSAQRSGLLTELTPASRERLVQLLEVIEPPAVRRDSAFERVLAETELTEAPQPHYSAAQLAAVFDAEGPALQRQLMTVLVHGKGELLTPHVQSIVQAYLQERAASLPAAAPAQPSRWRRWRRD